MENVSSSRLNLNAKQREKKLKRIRKNPQEKKQVIPLPKGLENYKNFDKTKLFPNFTLHHWITHSNLSAFPPVKEI